MKRNIGSATLACALFGMCLSSAWGAGGGYRKLLSPNSGSSADFGYSVATDGKTVIVGDRSLGTSGFAYLYDAVTGNFLASLNPGNAGGQGAQFGASVAIEGTTAVVGSWHAGAHVFDFSNLGNVTRTQLIPSSPVANFGMSVGISGGTIIVGASGDDRLGPFTGSAFLFDRTSLTQTAQLVASDAQAIDNFGIAVAIDGQRALVGSPFAKGFEDRRNGAVYEYDILASGEVRTENAKYFAPGQTTSNTQFGFAVDVRGDRIIAGEVHGVSYLWDAGSVPQALPGSGGDRSFPNFVGIDEQLAISGNYTTNLQQPPYEIATVYRAATGSFLTSFLSENPAQRELFGISADIAGGVAVVGAADAYGNAGAAYLFYIPEPATCTIAAFLCAVIGAARRASPTARQLRRDSAKHVV